ncbi:hypothetical protein [Oryza sativa Japonica Group]|uniref:Uncharacterized protein P0025A05.29 n=1 Tax=Oryza sativa subsp. japonica TaxID=39947 RepID=Q5ZAE5_ORYSJ|nr:hypothetical protein [Oryza sativa Japonica Group]
MVAGAKGRRSAGRGHAGTLTPFGAGEAGAAAWWGWLGGGVVGLLTWPRRGGRGLAGVATQLSPRGRRSDEGLVGGKKSGLAGAGAAAAAEGKPPLVVAAALAPTRDRKR